jgi:hypothetical protein
MTTGTLYRVFGCSHSSPVDYREEEGIFALELECPQNQPRFAAPEVAHDALLCS